jgi:hypothetical protein
MWSQLDRMGRGGGSSGEGLGPLALRSFASRVRVGGCRPRVCFHQLVEAAYRARTQLTRHHADGLARPTAEAVDADRESVGYVARSCERALSGCTFVTQAKRE